ncbi:hypothetical protein L6452_38487 [Arctium lappa]|uniref:Uncharacterized protein n=1 Tax=Arctium lappa TaxID=4217 RepID=A0ACB8XQ81_ARCLA|nr:hypothetical protein L6452_38487 [Arctium lappa]
MDAENPDNYDESSDTKAQLNNPQNIKKLEGDEDDDSNLNISLSKDNDDIVIDGGLWSFGYLRKLLRDNRGIRHKLRAYPLSQLLLLLNPQKDFAEFFVPPPSTVDDFGLAMVIVVVVVVVDVV